MLVAQGNLTQQLLLGIVKLTGAQGFGPDDVQFFSDQALNPLVEAGVGAEVHIEHPVSWYTTWLASMWYAIPCFSRMLRFNLQFMAGPPNRLANTVIASLSLLLPPGATHPVMW